MVSVDGAEPTLFATGANGSSTADWIRTGSTFEFRLYSDHESNSPLASVVVTRRRFEVATLTSWLVLSVAALVLVPVLLPASRAQMSPQRRMIAPEEVAHAALMLCAHDARGIHGQTIVIDGGAVLK